MNRPSDETTPLPMEEALLTLVMPPDLADLLADWLLEQPEVTGFISLPVNSHGGEEHSMTPAEQVAGYRKGWLIQTHLPRNRARDLLTRLKQAFSGSELHYWLTPMIEGGHLN